MAFTQLVQHLAEALVDHADSVDVREAMDGGITILALRVHPDDRGKVIGRRGQNARALRAVLAAASSRLNRRVVLNIVED